MNERSERARYRVERSKRNSISVLFFIFVRLRFVQDMDALRVKHDQLRLTLLVGSVCFCVSCLRHEITGHGIYFFSAPTGLAPPHLTAGSTYIEVRWG